MTAAQKQLEAFRRGNVMVAEIIMADPVPDPKGSLMRQVAETTLRGGVNIRAELERRAGVSMQQYPMRGALIDKLRVRDLAVNSERRTR